MFVDHKLMCCFFLACRAPHDPERLVVKRVLGLPGDEITTKPPYQYLKETVPPGHVWVEGDNVDPRFTRDSNYYGPVSLTFLSQDREWQREDALRV